MLVSRAITPPSLVCKIANFVPIGVAQLWNQSLPFERHFSQPKWARAFPIGDDFAQTLFDKCAKRYALTRRDFSKLRPAYGHFTTGGIDDRIESTLPSVLSPNTVPRS